MTLIIAEAGVNHNGDEDLAIELINKAKWAGVDIVKFQTFKANKLVTNLAKKAKYQSKNTKNNDSQLSMLQELELPKSSFLRLANYCKEIDIEFLSTAFDEVSLHFLVNELNQERLKIPSGEITNLPFVLEHSKTKLDIIVSTGMANLAEIEQALSVIAFGLISKKGTTPSLDEFEKAYVSKEGLAALKEKVTLLHCTTEYPAPLAEINLNAINTLRQSFKLNIGYSDHSSGIIIPVSAVAMGACLIEKHFTLDRKMNGPDHKASLEPSELKDMVTSIRGIEVALGDGIKRPYPSEVKNKLVARKSLIASSAIKVGEKLTSDNISIMRPGNGMPPSQYWRILNMNASKEYKEGDFIDE